jgi:hypothetical protein
MTAKSKRTDPLFQNFGSTLNKNTNHPVIRGALKRIHLGGNHLFLFMLKKIFSLFQSANALQGAFYAVRHNKIFELSVIAVIVFSAVTIGIRTYELPPLLVSLVGALDWVITGVFW